MKYAGQHTPWIPTLSAVLLTTRDLMELVRDCDGCVIYSGKSLHAQAFGSAMSANSIMFPMFGTRPGPNILGTTTGRIITDEHFNKPNQQE